MVLQKRIKPLRFFIGIALLAALIGSASPSMPVQAAGSSNICSWDHLVFSGGYGPFAGGYSGEIVIEIQLPPDPSYQGHRVFIIVQLTTPAPILGSNGWNFIVYFAVAGCSS